MNPFRVIGNAGKVGVKAVAAPIKAHPIAAGAAAGTMMAAPILGNSARTYAENYAPPQVTNPGMAYGSPATAPSSITPSAIPAQDPFNPASAPTQVAPIVGDVGDHAALRNTLLGDIRQRMVAAQQAGDRDTLYDLAAERGALDNGGFQGLARFRQEAGEAKLARDYRQAQIGMTNNKGKVGVMTPEAAWQQAMLKTGDQNIADAMEQRARIQQNAATAKETGKAPPVLPTDASAVLASNYPGVSGLFETDEKGKPGLDLVDVYHKLSAMNVPGMNDPKSEFAQAARHRIAAMYGSELPAQLDLPENPASYAPGMGLNQYLGATVNNLLGGHLTFTPQSYYDRRAPAVKWFQSINQAPAP